MADIEPRVLVACTCVGEFQKFYRGFMDCISQLDYPKDKWELYFSKPQIPPPGEMINNTGRGLSIKYALDNGFDWVMFIDVDIRPDKDVISKFLALNYPFVAGGLCPSDDSNWCIGHIYEDRKLRKRLAITKEYLVEPKTVDGAGGGLMMIHRWILKKIDMSLYKGPQAYLEGYQGSDEFMDNQIFEKTGFKPKIDSSIKAWHIARDGHCAARLWDKMVTGSFSEFFEEMPK